MLLGNIISNKHFSVSTTILKELHRARKMEYSINIRHKMYGGNVSHLLVTFAWYSGVDFIFYNLQLDKKIMQRVQIYYLTMHISQN